MKIVSPSNKDSIEKRSQFVARCAALLRERVSVIMVDLITLANWNLYTELLAVVGKRNNAGTGKSPGTYAVACQCRRQEPAGRLDTWNQQLEIGKPLPVLPLWLSDELAIPLDLEASYEQTCRDLWII